MNMNRSASALLLLAVAATAGAQQKGGKKLYCWEENGQRTCGDALPPGAIELARTEISASTGRTTSEVEREHTPEKIAAAPAREIGRAACKERGNTYVYIPGGSEIQKKNKRKT